MAEDSTEHLVAATLANGIMAAKGGTPTPIEAVALRVLRCPQAGVAFALFSNNVSAGCQAGETMKSKDRKQFSHRIDMWDDDGENVLEHLAGVEDFDLAMATYRAACLRWPGAAITIRQGARMLEDSRKRRLA